MRAMKVVFVALAAVVNVTARAEAPPFSVQIINPPSNPVAVHEQGTASVLVANDAVPVTGKVTVAGNMAFLDGRICPNDTRGVFNVHFQIPEGKILILEDVTFEIVRCLESEDTPITTSQVTPQIGFAKLGQMSLAVSSENGGVKSFSGRSFHDRVMVHATGSITATVWLDPPGFVSGFFFAGYGRLVDGDRAYIWNY